MAPPMSHEAQYVDLAHAIAHARPDPHETLDGWLIGWDDDHDAMVWTAQDPPRD